MNFPPGLEISIDDCQDVFPVDMALLLERAGTALDRLRDRAGTAGNVAGVETEVLEISLVSDAEIARIHGEFLDDPTPTDVITFDHGELIVGVEVASREAAERGWPLERELLLYVIHGMLHLEGLDDRLPEEREEMRRIQEGILDLVWPWPS